jgi:hypothetical protein
MAESDWHPNGIAAFFKSDYTFDDAKILSELWSIPLKESKQALGHKVINNIEHLLPQEVNPPKIDPEWDINSLTAFFKSDYTYDDAEELASLWNISPYKAKKTIGHKIVNNIQNLLPEGLQKPATPDVDGLSPDWDPNGLDAFFKSDYTFEDAKALGDMWNIGIIEAKQALGHKVINKIQDLLPRGLQDPNSKVDTSPGANFQAYVKSEYDYDDAVLLASLWSLGVPEAKNEIGYHVLQGTDSKLPDKLRENDAPPKHADDTAKYFKAFSKSEYDYDDAALLAQLWDRSIGEAKHIIGFKVVNKITHFLPDELNKKL